MYNTAKGGGDTIQICALKIQVLLFSTNHRIMESFSKSHAALSLMVRVNCWGRLHPNHEIPQLRGCVDQLDRLNHRVEAGDSVPGSGA